MLTVTAKMWLFHLKRSSLSINIIREICSYLADYKLVQVTSTWGPELTLRTPIQVNEYSTWVVLEDVCSAAEEVFPRQSTLQSGVLRVSWTVMEQWNSCPTCSLQDAATESFNCLTSSYLEAVNSK